MTERVIATRFTANVSNYVANVELASRTTRVAAQTLAQQRAAALAAAQAQRDASVEIGTALLAVGTVAAVGIGLAVSKFSDFDQAISNVKAATQESAENMGLLREAALEAGADTVYSATEAAGAIEELGKAGLTTEQILNGGLDGALSLAAAGAMDVAEAASIAAITVKQFNLAGSDVPHVADLLAAGAGKAVGDVSDLGAALGQAGLVANQTGLSIEETTGVLAAFADKGLLGSDSGTALKTMLQSLVPSSEAAAKEMDRLGISAYDANGQFIGAAEFAGNYRNALHDLTPEQQAATSKIIFGSDAVRAANVFYELGAEGIQKYVDQTNDSGYAAKVAADRLNNLGGDVEKLGGAFDTYLIKSGSGANDMLRTLTQSVTGMIDGVGSLSEPVLGGALAVGGLVTAVVLAGGAFLVAVPKIAAFKASLTTVGLTGRSAAIGIGALSGGLAVAGIAFSVFAGNQAKATATASEFKDSLDATSGSITDYTRDLVAKKLAESGAFDSAKAAGISQKELTNAVLEGGDALEKVKKTLSGKNTALSFFDFSEAGGIAAGNAQTTVRELSEGLVKSKEDWRNQAAAAEDAAGSTGVAASAIEDMAGASEVTSESVDDLAESIRGFGATNLSARDAARNFEESIDSVTESVIANGTSLDIAEEAGRSNQSALDDLARSALESAAAIYEQTGSQEGANAEIARGREELIKQLDQFGITGEAANAYADELGLIPGSVSTAVALNADEAQAKLDEFLLKLNNIPGYKEVVINEVIKQTGAARGEVAAAYDYAVGGAVSGPGTATSDSIPARLSNGEHVLTAEDVRAMGGQGGVYAFRRDLYQGFARGGAVRYSAASESRGDSSSSVTNRNVNQTWNVASNGDDPSALAAKIDGRVNWSMRRLS